MAKSSIFSILEVVCLFLALFLAGIYGNNDLSFRIATPSLFLVLGSLSLVIRYFSGNAKVTVSSGVIFMTCLVLYFVVRAILSESESYGEKDLILFVSAWFAGLLLLEEENRRFCRLVLPWFCVCMIIVQSVPLIWQFDDPTFVPFREVLVNKKDISGFFGHRNFFALLVGVCSMVLVSFTAWWQPLSRSLSTSLITKATWSIFAMYGFLLVYLSHSRGALISIFIGLFLIVLVTILFKALMKPKNRKWYLLGSACFLLVIGLIGGVAMNRVADQRGIEEGFLFLNARQDMLLLSADSQPENKWIGGGARFFQDEALRVWDVERMNNSLGDPRVVHNEFVESYVNYGYIGVILFIALVVISLSKSATRLAVEAYLAKVNQSASVEMPIVVAVMGILIAVIIQCFVDFTLHVLPLTMVFGMVVCWLMTGFQSVKRFAIVPLVMSVCVIILFSYKIAPYWLGLKQYEEARIEQQTFPAIAADKFHRVGMSTGDVYSLMRAGHLYAREGMKGAEVNASILDEAIEAYSEARVKAPANGLISTQMGEVYLDKGQYDKALLALNDGMAKLGASQQRVATRKMIGIITYLQFKEELRDPLLQKQFSVQDLIARYEQCLRLIASDHRHFRSKSRKYQDLIDEAYGYHALYVSFDANYSAKQYRDQKNVEAELAYLKYGAKRIKVAKKYLGDEIHSFYIEQEKKSKQRIQELLKLKVVADTQITKSLETSVIKL